MKRVVQSYYTHPLLMARHTAPGAWPEMDAGQLRPSRSLMVCLTCQHFQHTLGEAGVTQPACAQHQQRLPQGTHLNYRCHRWMQRLEQEIGWCPESS